MYAMRLKVRKLLRTVLLFVSMLLLGLYIAPDFPFKVANTLALEVISSNQTSEDWKIDPIAAVELRYGEFFASLNESEVKSLNRRYNHDVALYWSVSGPLHRIEPQSRPLFDASCLEHGEQKHEVLVSIVICHKNELVYSVFRVLAAINKYTPKGLLKEVLIIDDGSDSDDAIEIGAFGQVLGIPIYTSRNAESIGIAQCRYWGIRAVTGDVIVILDSHMEVSERWLEPLLHILELKPKALAVPLVDMVKEVEYPENLHLTIQPYIYDFTFGYSLMHRSDGGPPEKNRSHPFLSPSLGGGAIVAYKSTLLDFYPKGITTKYFWGIENNRLALRAWLCGDGIWISACSQVSHLTGPDLALDRYAHGGFFAMKAELERENLGEILNFLGNDDDKRKFLDRTYFSDIHYQEINDMADEISVDFDHKTLCSKSYYWYLKNIHTSIHYEFFESTDFLHVGEVQSKDGRHCLHCFLLGSDGVFVEPFCRGAKTVFWDTHLFGFAANGAVYTSNPDMLCWDAGEKGEGARISQYPCHNRSLTGEAYSSQKFEYDTKSLQIRHSSSNRCVELVKNDSGAVQALLTKCSSNNLQKWIINRPEWVQK